MPYTRNQIIENRKQVHDETKEQILEMLVQKLLLTHNT
jgi:hypothetical protein